MTSRSPGWRKLYEACRPRADEIEPGLADELGAELAALEQLWPKGLPQGVIHADLFPDNVFFRGEAVSGLIDFYFACNDAFAYDVAICLNAWCFENDGSFNITKARLLLAQLPRAAQLRRGGVRRLAAPGARQRLRFLLTRLYDRLNHPRGRAGEAQGPARIPAEAALPPRRDTGSAPTGSTRDEGGAQDRHLHGRRLQRQSGPRRLGRAPASATAMRRSCSGSANPTTNNRMEMMAAIAALEALKRPSAVRLHTDSMYLRDGITRYIHKWKVNGWKTADKKPVKNIDLWQRLEAALERHRVEWHWVRGHAGHPENERADALARQGVEQARGLSE